MASRRLTVVLDLDSGRYSGRMREASTVTKRLQGTVDQSSKSMRGLGNTFDRTGRQMSTPLQKLRDYVLILGNVRMALLNVRDIAVGWVANLMKQSAEVERLTVLMRGLSKETSEFGKAQEARTNLAQLFALSRQSGIAVQSLADSFVKMKSAGVDPLNGSLYSLVDAVSAFGGTSDTFHRASIAIQQMAGKGVISMEELRQQLGEAIPTAMFDMANGMGMGMEEFVKKVSDGAVEAGPALDAMFMVFEAKYKGSARRLAETFNGQLSIVKTNIMDLANFFTGLNLADQWRDEQIALLDQGKITRAQLEEILNAGPPEGTGGLFDSLKEGLKEFNTALQSNEAKIFMADLGQSIGIIATNIIEVIKWSIAWREELGFMFKLIAGAFLIAQSQKLISYFFTIGQSSLAAFRNIGLGAQSAVGPMSGLVTWGERVVRSQDVLAAKQVSRINLLRNQVTAQNANIASLTKESTQLMNNARSWDITSKSVAARTAAASKALAQGKISGRYRDFETGQFISQAKAIENNNRMQLLNAQAKANATRATQAAIAADSQLTAAKTTQAVALNRSNVLIAANTMRLQAMAMAARVAGTAVMFVGRAINFLLGPAGIVISIIASIGMNANSAAGGLNNMANAARNAAMGIYDLADAERLREDKGRLERQIGKVGTFANSMAGLIEYIPGMRSVHQAFDSMFDTTTAWVDPDSVPALESRVAEISAQILEIGEGAAKLDMQNTADQYRRMADEAVAGIQAKGANERAAIEADTSLTDTARAKLMQESFKKQSRLSAEQQQIQIDALAAERDKWAKYGEDDWSFQFYDQALGRLRMSLNQTSPAFNTYGAAVDGAADISLGAAPAVESVGTAATKTGKQAAAATPKVDKWAKAIQEGMVKVAELQEELATGGSSSEIAKFAARLRLGRFEGASEAQIDALRNIAMMKDTLKTQIDIQKTMSDLDREITKTGASAATLWDGFKTGSYEAARSAARVEDQFADMVEGLTGADLDEALAKIEQIKNNLNLENAAEVANDWNLVAQEIEISLMDENLQRQMNFDLEMQRQRALIDMSRLSAQQRADAEAAFQRFRKAKQAEMARESESSVIKMSRDWIKLGQNMDEALSGALSNMVDGLAEGELAFDDFAVEIVKSLIKIILKAIIAYAIMSALGIAPQGGIGGMIQSGLSDFGGGFGGGSSGGSKSNGNAGSPPVDGDGAGVGHWSVGVNHNGGKIGASAINRMVSPSAFAGAPRYHGGGLVSGEVPIIAEEGEIILNTAQQKNVASSMKPNVQVNVINNGSDAEAEVSEPRFDGKQMIVDVVLESASKPGPMRDLLKSMK